MDNMINDNESATESSRSAESNDRPRRTAHTARRDEQHQHQHQRRSASPERSRTRTEGTNQRRRTPPPAAQPPPTLRDPIKAAHSQISAFLTIRKAASTGEDDEAYELQREAQPMLENMLKADFPAAIVAYCMIDQGEVDKVLGRMYVDRFHEAGVMQTLWGSRSFQRLFDTKRGATRVAWLLCSGYATGAAVAAAAAAAAEREKGGGEEA